MWLLIAGIVLLVVAAVLHSYCAIGVKARPTIAPEIFYSRANIFLQIGWILLFIVGTAMLFLGNWIVGIVAIPVYWFVLPLLITPSMKKYMLGSWDDNKHILEKHGYNKKNYLHGDWWKK